MAGSESENPSREGPDRNFRLKRLAGLVIGSLVVVFIVHEVIELTAQNALPSRFTPKRWIDLSARGPLSSGARPEGGPLCPPLHVAIAPVVCPEKSLVLYQGLANFVAKALEKEAVLMQRATYTEINDLVRYRHCDFAFICTYAFVRGERDFGMEALAVPVIGGRTQYHSFIIVPRTSDALSLLDLRGMRFAFTDILSNSGWLYPMYWLKKRNEDPKAFFPTKSSPVATIGPL